MKDYRLPKEEWISISGDTYEEQLYNALSSMPEYENDPVLISAAIGNARWENRNGTGYGQGNVNPNGYSSNGSLGIFQWDNRRTDLCNFCIANGFVKEDGTADWSNMEAQVNFHHWENTHTEKQNFNLFVNNSRGGSVENAAYQFAANYERCGDRDSRGGEALFAYNSYGEYEGQPMDGNYMRYTGISVGKDGLPYYLKVDGEGTTELERINPSNIQYNENTKLYDVYYPSGRRVSYDPTNQANIDCGLSDYLYRTVPIPSFVSDNQNVIDEPYNDISLDDSEFKSADGRSLGKDIEKVVNSDIQKVTNKNNSTNNGSVYNLNLGDNVTPSTGLNSAGAVGITKPNYSTGSSTTGTIKPNYSTGSSTTGTVKPNYSTGTNTTGTVRPNYSTGTNTTGTVRPNYSTGSSTTGTVRPNYSTGSSTTGTIKPNYSTGSSTTVTTRPVVTTVASNVSATNRIGASKEEVERELRKRDEIARQATAPYRYSNVTTTRTNPTTRTIVTTRAYSTGSGSTSGVSAGSYSTGSSSSGSRNVSYSCGRR